MKKKEKKHPIEHLDLKGKRVCIIGLQGSGKSYLAKYILKNYKKVFIIDPMDEYQIVDKDRNRVRIVVKDDLIPDIVMETIENTDLDMLIVDEISRFAPSRKAKNKRLRDYADACRHMGTTFVGIARRAGQVYTDYVELAHYLFIFRLRGKNDGIWLANQAEGLPSTVHGLKQYEFVCLYPDRSYEVFPPVKMREKI